MRDGEFLPPLARKMALKMQPHVPPMAQEMAFKMQKMSNAGKVSFEEGGEIDEDILDDLHKAASLEIQRLNKLSDDEKVALLQASGLNYNPNVDMAGSEVDNYILSARNSLAQIVIRGVRDTLNPGKASSVAGDFAALVAQSARISPLGSLIGALDVFGLVSSAPEVRFIYECGAGGCVVSGVELADSE